MTEVLFAMLPVFLILAAGLAADRGAFLPPTSSLVLNVYILRFALPVLLLRIIAGAEPGELFQGRLWFGLLATQFTAYGLGYAWDFFLARRGHGPAVITAMSCSCCLSAFVGLPVIMNLLPGNREAMVMAAILSITPTVGIAVAQMQLDIQKMSGGSAKTGELWRIPLRALFLNPMVLGMLGGVALCLAGTGLWVPLDRAAAMVGNTAAPCALLSLGLEIRNKLRAGFAAKGARKGRHQAGIALVKLLAHPLLTWGLLALCGVDGVWLAVCVIMSGTGTAVGSYVVADLYKIVPEESALSVVITISLSLITLSAFAYAFKAMGFI